MLNLQEHLHKQSSPLTEQQQKDIEQHPFKSREILQGLGITHNEWLDTVQNHHERPDGRGYPNGLQADDVSLYARTLSLTDIYSAMVLPREYRDGFHVKKALRDIFMQRGGAVDMDLAQLLIKELGIYPPGTFVQLANGDIAIVIRRGVKQANAPIVLNIMSPRGAPYKNPQRRDTKHQDLYGIVKVIPRIDDLKLDRNQIWGLGKK
nr:HD domain-containing phosphohydrolase [Methylomarinum sp. Ch1-1]MDP4522798.1 HD domain-containing phosphohydrolase [Methylomarinum sp. Ch1-1]